jgi:hypothetical protein
VLVLPVAIHAHAAVVGDWISLHVQAASIHVVHVNAPIRQFRVSTLNQIAASTLFAVSSEIHPNCKTMMALLASELLTSPSGISI